jgi:hypothetical protein
LKIDSIAVPLEKYFLIKRSDDQDLEVCFSQDEVDAWTSIQLFPNAVGENTAELKFDAGGNKTLSKYLKENISTINNKTIAESVSLAAQIQVNNSMSKENISPLFKLEIYGSISYLPHI